MTCAAVSAQPTQFNMQPRVQRRWLLAMLVLGLMLSGCSFVRLSYEHFPRLAQWEIDRHLDLDAAQKALLARHLDALHVWHQREQLLQVGAFLQQLESGAHEPVDANRVGAWRSQIAQAWAALADRMAPAVAELGVSLRPEQLRKMRERFSRANAKFRDEYLPDDPQAVLRARAERWIKRAKFFLGELTPGQVQELTDAAMRMTPSEAAWLAEREARQQRLLALLERLSVEKPASATAVELSRQMLRGYWSLEGSAQKAALERDISASDALAAKLLTRAQAGQRSHFSQMLRAYRSDAEELAGRAQRAVESGSQSPRT